MDEPKRSKVKEVCDRLLNNLDELLTSYRLLLDITRREKEAIQDLKLDVLQEINLQKEDILLKIRSQDATRERYAVELGQLLNLDSQNPRLLELAEVVDPDLAQKFRQAHAAISLVLQRLQRINQQNRSLVQSQLQVLNSALEELKGHLGKKTTYGKDKKIETSQASILQPKEA